MICVTLFGNRWEVSGRLLGEFQGQSEVIFDWLPDDFVDMFLTTHVFGRSKTNLVPRPGGRRPRGPWPGPQPLISRVMTLTIRLMPLVTDKCHQ